jgi:hypothetical protein
VCCCCCCCSSRQVSGLEDASCEWAICWHHGLEGRGASYHLSLVKRDRDRERQSAPGNGKMTTNCCYSLSSREEVEEKTANTILSLDVFKKSTLRYKRTLTTSDIVLI